ncbi:hypothetical protein TRICHSKD4_5072 [Roseibium sp. TrichSKD4]|uniref:hypothetical protein n=1 Tax=Roseibium sp. TrichSKD4 TaxID=744980 RepID=UPI0001E57407|nr:hypothetical protein [Roseibium sp. TrichSKD4]EFO29250.1 hypothetical protein TRICHSKD4_5072 [Roseibium sp. TrichSKD4]
MPVAVILAENTVPAILEEASDAALFDAVCELAVVPDSAKADQASLKDWINTLPLPSGWFADSAEAKAFPRRIEIEQDAKLIKALVDQPGQTQRGLTAAIGLAGEKNDGSQIRKMMSAKQGLSGTGRRALAYFLKYGPMDRKEEAEILNKVDNGSWRKVKRSDIRSARRTEGMKLA